MIWQVQARIASINTILHAVPQKLSVSLKLGAHRPPIRTVSESLTATTILSWTASASRHISAVNRGRACVAIATAQTENQAAKDAQRKAFKFKQFCVFHDKCSHKVGLDGCLLGAWVAAHIRVPPAASILDVGTGSGVIALMLAQAFHKAHVTAIDVDALAYEQAAENFQCSPFSDRLALHHSSLQDFASAQPSASYTLLVSNPPYYIQGRSDKSPQDSRAIARQNYLLPFSSLLACSSELLADHGLLCVILPVIEAKAFVKEAEELGTLDLVHKVCVRTRKDGVKGDVDKRHILLLQRQPRGPQPTDGDGCTNFDGEQDGLATGMAGSYGALAAESITETAESAIMGHGTAGAATAKTAAAGVDNFGTSPGPPLQAGTRFTHTDVTEDEKGCSAVTTSSCRVQSDAEDAGTTSTQSMAGRNASSSAREIERYTAGRHIPQACGSWW